MAHRISLPWRIAAIVIAAALALLWTAPLLWAMSTALRPEHEAVLGAARWLPGTWTLGAFAKVLAAGSLPRWLFNSALVALLVAAMTVALSITAAYAFSQMRFRGSRLVLALSVAAFMLPFEAMIVPLFRMMNAMRLIDTYAGVILPQLVSPVAVYVFKGFFDAIPREFREAAEVDGASSWQILWRIYLPMSSNIVWGMAIVVFIGAWNNFLWPFVIITSSEMMTIPLGLTQTQDAFGVHYAQTMAAALLGGMPVALAYALFQRRVMEGMLASSGLKG